MGCRQIGPGDEELSTDKKRINLEHFLTEFKAHITWKELIDVI